MSYRLTVEQYSHGCRIRNYDRDVFKHIEAFLEGLKLKDYTQDRFGRSVLEIKKKFFLVTEDQTETFIHRHHLPEFLAWMAGRSYPSGVINHIYHDAPPALYAAFELKEGWTPREYQVPIVDKLIEQHYSFSLKLQTGLGKTASALFAVSQLKQRLSIMIAPKYFGIWEEALKDIFPQIGKRFVFVKGSDQLKAIINSAVNGTLDIDAVLISAPSYRAYIETYERFGAAGCKVMGYAVPPYEFHKALGIGIQINDEIQDDPGLVFRTDIMTNVGRQYYLSATPFTGSEFVTQMIDVMLPSHTDCPLPELDVYVDVVAVIYSDPSIKPKDVSRYKGNYSHSAYEDAITKKPERQKAYFNMVRKLVHTLYGRDKLPKQKLLILCSTVEFIEKLRKFLVTAFPDLKINGHVSGSPYAALLAADVTISTPKSAGTGVDIPDLREVLMLLCTDSRKDNLQIIGRLRRMKNFPTVTPRLTYVACRNVQQQMKYHNNKHGIFDKRVLTHKVFQFTS